MPDFVPQIVLAYIKDKKLTPAFSYKDVWHEEHATGFTVAKAMQLDVLSDLHKSVISAVEQGQSFATFKKNIKPLLMQKGWWGKKKMTDPLTGKEMNAQLGSDRRLKTIYSVNMRSAYQKEQYEQTMKSELHPYLMYRIGPSVNHREDHKSWDGLILPKTDPWWDSHLPPNGWGCKCYTRAVSGARLARYKKDGVPVPPAADGTGGGTLAIKTEAPPVNYKTYFNERKGTFEQVPEGIDPAFNWNVGKAKADAAAAQKLAQSKKDCEAAASAKPKKETKKKLEADIAALDAQIKMAKLPEAVAGLEAKKAETQKLLDEKISASEKKTLIKKVAALQKELDGITVKTYSGIWKTEVTTADWAEKSGSVGAKKEYFKHKLQEGGIADADKIKFEQFIKDLDEFDAEGKRYHTIFAELQKTQTRLTFLKKGGNIKNAADDAFTPARKDAAVWAKSTREADSAVRDTCGAVWKRGAKAEKEAVRDYTSGSGKFNRPLSGYQKPYSEGGTGWETRYFKGPGKVWIDFEGAGDEIRKMTDLVSRSTYDFDMWLQRGSGYEALETHLGIARGSLATMTQKEIDNFVDTEFINYAFTSTAVNKGSGFSGDIIWNIYAPRGTQMMYAEPFSAYGHGGGLKWDGISKQADFGGEAEMIVQRGARYKITKIEKKGNKLFMDVEIHPEKGYKLIQQDPADWNGSTDTFK
jgi:hypothetical protein